MPPTPAPMSPEWWLTRLVGNLQDLQSDYSTLDAYYRGDHPLPRGTSDKAKRAYRHLLARGRSNWMALVVDAVTERLRVEGFRVGGDTQSDQDVWNRLWQANHLDAEQRMVYTEAVLNARAYVLVDPFSTVTGDMPRITPEHPAQVYVEHSPGDRRRRDAAVKLWVDDRVGEAHANLYLPNVIYKYRAPVKGGSLPQGGKLKWEPREPEGEDWPLEHDLGVPMVPFYNNARMLKQGVSEIAGVLDIQDRVNETLFQRLLAAQFAAFRQRWASGIKVQEDADGNPVEPFAAEVDRLWVAEDKDVKFGEFTESNLKNYIEAVEADIQHIAAITRTPPHYLLGQSGAFPSGESLKATETGLVMKVRSRQEDFGEAWEEVLRLASHAGGLGEVPEHSEVDWRDPESRTEGELVDSLLKMAALNVPQEALWRRWGATPTEIARWKTMQTSTLLLRSLEDVPETPETPA